MKWSRRQRNVYFIRPVGAEGPIKIGCSAYISERLKVLAWQQKQPLEVVASAPGNHGDERAVHLHLAAHRLSGEWFSPDPPVLAAIAHVVATGALPPITDRLAIMADLYRNGWTLREIGDQFSMTRERVRQILRDGDVPSLGWRNDIERRARRRAHNTDQQAAA